MGGALVALDPSLCPVDATPVHVIVVGQPALFFHGGYGATRETVMRWCAVCGWSIVASVGEARP